MCNCNVRLLMRLSINSFKQSSYGNLRLLYSCEPRYVSNFTFGLKLDGRKITGNNLSLTQHAVIRNYAKGKDKPKSSKGGKVLNISDDELAEFTNVKKLREELSAAVASLKDEYVKQVSLRSAAGSIESLPVMFEGQEYTLQDLAQISRKGPKLVVLNMALFPQTIPTVIDVINKSGMNLNPQQDSTSIYIEIPKITKEHREGLAKNANSLFVKCKTKINEIMAFHIKKLDTNLNQGMSVEQFRLVQSQITAIAKSYLVEAEKLKNSKQTEVLGEN